MKINLSTKLEINTVFILHRYVCTALGCRRILFGTTVPLSTFSHSRLWHFVVPWHQFVYTLFIPCGRVVIKPASFRSSSFAKHLPAMCSFIFGNRNKSDGARFGLYGGCSKMSHCSKACVCRAVCGRAFSCNRTIPRESFPLRQDNQDLIGLQKTNNTSHLTVGGILNRHRHDHNYLCTCHVTRSDVQLHEATFQHHTEHQKLMIGCNKTGARIVCADVLYFLNVLRINH